MVYTGWLVQMHIGITMLIAINRSLLMESLSMLRRPIGATGWLCWDTLSLCWDIFIIITIRSPFLFPVSSTLACQYSMPSCAPPSLPRPILATLSKRLAKLALAAAKHISCETHSSPPTPYCTQYNKASLPYINRLSFSTTWSGWEWRLICLIIIWYIY